MKHMRSICYLAMAGIILMGVLTVGTAVARAEEHAALAGVAAGATEKAGDLAASGAPYYAIALVMGTACIAAAYAVGKVGAAALGAAAEKPELLGRAIVFVGLGEGIAIFGLIISLMLINKLP